MSDPRHRMTAVDVSDERQTLEILWKDGHESTYPLKYLRAECPCAGCRTEREDAKRNPFHVVAKLPSDRLTGIEAVGRYGMKITWADGHDTGIYTFEDLRALCPCEACAASRPQTDAPYVHGIHIP
jgi:DUF971 family protein